MGLFDRIKQKASGVVPPEQGVDAMPAEDVAERLLAISGKGIETSREGDEVVVAWTAGLTSAGPLGASKDSARREIRVTLDGDAHEARARQVGEDSEVGGGAGGGGLSFGGEKSWSSGRQWGGEMHKSISIGGRQHGEGAADAASASSRSRSDLLVARGS